MLGCSREHPCKNYYSGKELNKKACAFQTEQVSCFPLPFGKLQTPQSPQHLESAQHRVPLPLCLQQILSPAGVLECSQTAWLFAAKFWGFDMSH